MCNLGLAFKILLKRTTIKIRINWKEIKKPLWAIHQNWSKNIVYIQNLCIKTWFIYKKMWKNTHTQFIHMDYLFIILYKHNNIHFVSTLVHSWHIEHHASCLFILYIFFSPCHTEIVTVRHFPHTHTPDSEMGKCVANDSILYRNLCVFPL